MSSTLKSLKSTLRLPSSKFPHRPTADALKTYISRCDDLYAWQRQHRPAENRFILHDGPPYANGDLHVGHALNKIVKDIICRTQLAVGKRVDYTPGWDCHGLPIELKALEKNKWGRGQDVDPVKIRGAARGFAQKAVASQMEKFRSWGIMADWTNHWKTMDKDFELRQLQVFKKMVEGGLIVRRHKPVYWSPSSKTALAEAEIERAEHTSTAAFVKFRLNVEGKEVGEGIEGEVYLAVWTTTPWTLPANQAIALNEGIRYCLIVLKEHGNLVVAKDRVESLCQQLGVEIDDTRSVEPSFLVGLTYSGHQGFGQDSQDRPIIHADFVSKDEGTGLVHCAPGHGHDDYVALQAQISSGKVKVKAPVDDGGNFTTDAYPSDSSVLAGKYVFKEGNQAVLKLLEQDNLLLKHYNFKHKYPIDWRTKGPIITRATAQWFADVSKIKADVLKALDSVKFVPETGESRLRSFVENRSEWCISRQRAWGVPIPALYHKKTGKAIMTPESISHIISTIQERGIDTWWSDNSQEPAWIMPGLNSSDYVRGRDTMDVWFDSGTSWALMSATQGWQPQNQPLADVYIEGSDQHRGWFQSSLLTNVAYQKAVLQDQSTAHAPFKQLITHGFTLDAQGKKMSKSIGNVVSPDQIIAGLALPQAPKKGRQVLPLGPDALRLWAASSDWTSDVTISERVVSNIHKTLEKYRITFRVLLGMLEDWDPSKSKNIVPYEHLADHGSIVNHIALHHLSVTSTNVRTHLLAHEFHKATAALNEYLARDLSALYLEAVKDTIYCDSLSSPRRLAAQTTMFHIFSQLQHMIGPICPLLIEETHTFSPSALKSYAGHPHQRIWDPTPEEWHSADLKKSLPTINTINSAVKAAQEVAREKKVLGQSLACEVDLYLDLDGKEIASLPSSLHNKDKSDATSTGNEHWETLLVVSRATTHSASEQQCIETEPDTASAQSQDTSAAWRETIDIPAPSVYGPGCSPIDTNPQAIPIGRVVLSPPSKGKCDRCWRYAVPLQSRPELKESEKVEEREKGKETPASLCERCKDVVAEYEQTQTQTQTGSAAQL